MRLLYSISYTYVLILVLVEDGLGGSRRHRNSSIVGMSLNPCFVEGWSWSITSMKKYTVNSKVLILVLLEDGLGGISSTSIH